MKALGLERPIQFEFRATMEAKSEAEALDILCVYFWSHLGRPEYTPNPRAHPIDVFKELAAHYMPHATLDEQWLKEMRKFMDEHVQPQKD